MDIKELWKIGIVSNTLRFLSMVVGYMIINVEDLRIRVVKDKTLANYSLLFYDSGYIAISLDSIMIENVIF